jgi:iron complex outermembrane receptor protein
MSYDFKKGRILPAICLRGKINNLFNAMYISNGAIYDRDAYYFPQAGINFMMGIDIKF